MILKELVDDFVKEVIKTETDDEEIRRVMLASFLTGLAGGCMLLVHAAPEQGATPTEEIFNKLKETALRLATETQKMMLELKGLDEEKQDA